MRTDKLKYAFNYIEIYLFYFCFTTVFTSHVTLKYRDFDNKFTIFCSVLHCLLKKYSLGNLSCVNNF